MPHGITDRCNGCGACARICPAGAVAGERKRPHAVEPRLCIDCGACGRVCPQGAVLDARGTPCKAMKRSEWTIPVIAIEKCMACFLCVEACPAGCLTMSLRARTGGVDPYPYIQNENQCLACGFCVQTCPLEAVSMGSPSSGKGGTEGNEAKLAQGSRG